MKRLIFLLMAFTLTLSVSIANDVGKLPADIVITEMVAPLHVDFMPALTVPANTVWMYSAPVATLPIMKFNCTPQISPDGKLWIDPGRCTQVSVATKFNFTNTSSHQTNSYTPYAINGYNESTRNCKVFVLTARHVFFIV